MTKGVGVNKELFGETTGELVKPGMTRADLEAIEKRGVGDGPDPFGDVFKEAKQAAASPPPDAAAAAAPARAPLPDQCDLFPGFSSPSLLAASTNGGPPKGGFKVELCQFWPVGTCHKGEACTYAHGEADLRK